MKTLRISLIVCCTCFLFSAVCNAQPKGKWERVSTLHYNVGKEQIESFFVLDSVTAFFEIYDPYNYTDNFIEWTDDGGKTWGKREITLGQLAGVLKPFGKETLFLLSYDTLTDGRPRSTLYKSSDQSRSWQFVRTDTIKYFQLSMFDSQYGFHTVDSSNTGNRHAILTADGAKTFPTTVTDTLLLGRIVHYPSFDSEYYYSYMFAPVSPTTILAYGKKSKPGTQAELPMLYSSDKGTKWHFCQSFADSLPFMNPPTMVLNTPFVTRVTTANNPSKRPKYFAYSTDEGKTWEKSFPYDTSIRQASYFRDGSAWIYSRDSILAYTSDNGTSWYKDSVTARGVFIGTISFASGGYGYAYATNAPANDSLIYIFRYSEQPSSVTEHMTKAHTSKLSGYPNPSSKYLRVSTNMPASRTKIISVSDVMGRMVKIPSSIQDSLITFDTSELPNRNYNIVIEDGPKFFVYRFLVLH